MHFNLIHWLFDDPLTAGTNAGLSGPETFHFLYPWLIFCSVGVLIAFYYSVEGRKRFRMTIKIGAAVRQQNVGEIIEPAFGRNVRIKLTDGAGREIARQPASDSQVV